MYMDTSNSMQSNLNVTEKTDKDGEATDTIERKTLQHPEQNTDINTYTEHFCRNVLNNGGRQTQEENNLSSSAVNFHVVDPPAIRNAGNSARTIDQSDNEDLSLCIGSQDFPKPVQNIDDFKTLSDQPVDIDLDMDIPKHKHIQRNYETITDNTNNSEEYGIATTKPELGVTSRDESTNNQMHLSETELWNLGVDISYQVNFHETEEDYLINEYNSTEYQINGFHQTAYHRNGYHLTEYQRNGYHLTEYQRNGYHLTEYQRNGYHLTEYQRDGYHLTEYQRNGYHLTEYQRDGYHLTEYQRNGFHLTEYQRNGYHLTEYQRNGYHLTEYQRKEYHQTEYQRNGYHLTEYQRNEFHQPDHRNEYHQTEYHSSMRHELFMNFNSQRNVRFDSLSLTCKVKKYMFYISWYYKNLKDTLSLKKRVNAYFEEYSNCQFQYSLADKMHVIKYYQKEAYKFLFELLHYQCNIIAYPVIRVEPEYFTPPVNINDVNSRGLVTTYYESEVDDHGHDGLTSHAQAAHTQSAHAQAAHTQAALTQAAHAQGPSAMHTGIVLRTENTMNLIARGLMVQVTASTTSMNTSTTGSQYSFPRGTYRMAAETVQVTANMMNVSARTEQRAQEAYSMTGASGHSTYYGTGSMRIGTNLRTSGLSTHNNSSADARSVNNTLGTIAHSQETRNSRQERGNQASSVIESDPVRIEDQPLGANHLADLIKQHIHQNGSQLQRTPLAGQDRPDMCSPDTVTTVLTSAILQNRFILDYFRIMGATGAQVLEIVRNYLHQNYGSVTAVIRQMVLEKHGDAGDIHSEVDVISAIIGKTKIKIMTTCSNRIIEASLVMRYMYQGDLTSTFVNSYLNQQLLGSEEPCGNCSHCQRKPPGIKQIVRSIESTFIYINASPGRVPKAYVRDMLGQIRVGESAYQVHALSFWNDNHFNARINIDNMWWTYDNKRGIFNQGLEVDDGMPGILSGIYLKIG